MFAVEQVVDQWTRVSFGSEPKRLKTAAVAAAAAVAPFAAVLNALSVGGLPVVAAVAAQYGPAAGELWQLEAP